jgi:hypothetical protein
MTINGLQQLAGSVRMLGSDSVVANLAAIGSAFGYVIFASIEDWEADIRPRRNADGPGYAKHHLDEIPLSS